MFGVGWLIGHVVDYRVGNRKIMKKAFFLAVSTAVLLGNIVLGVTVMHPELCECNESFAGAAAGLTIGDWLLCKVQQLMARCDALVAARCESSAACAEEAVDALKHLRCG